MLSVHTAYRHKTIQDLYVTYSFVSFMEDFEKNPLVSDPDGHHLPLLKILIDDGICTHFNTLSCIQITKVILGLVYYSYSICE